VQRVYAHPVGAVWSAFASAVRLSRWFIPVTGELRQGGRFQFTGNAGGTIETCEPERRVVATWEFGGGVSWVELLFVADDTGTRVTLHHTANAGDMPPGFWEQYGPGATGVGWDLGFVGLALHLDAPEAPRPADAELAYVGSAEGRAYVIASARDWSRAARAGGLDAGTTGGWAAELVAFYTGRPLAEGE
jgi:uncharacterized protein YndB with AHSA1/START domain